MFYTRLYVERRRKMSTIADDTRGGMRNVWIITAAMTVLAICYTMIIPFCLYISWN